jgi:hypothetical protein
MLIHGPESSILYVLNGLVDQNERALRAGYLPRLEKLRGISYDDSPIWRDGLSVLVDGQGSAGSMAAWRTAQSRVGGVRSEVAIVGGLPVSLEWDRQGAVSVNDPSLQIGRRAGRRVYAIEEPEQGLHTAEVLFTVDDNSGTSIMAFGNRIAAINTQQIKRERLPKLYESGVRYGPENGDLWLDAIGIIRRGVDDCEGLAAYRAAELVNEGHVAGVWTRLVPTGQSRDMGGSGNGGRLFHAVTGVFEPDGRFYVDDPSVACGMKVPQFYREHARRQRARGLDL